MIKNTASQYVSAQLVAVADGEDITSGTTTVYVTGDAGTQSSGSGTVTHEGNGCWSYAPTQGETNYDHVAYTFVNTSAVSVTVQRDPVTASDYQADVSSLATAANLATVDTVVDAIKVVTDALPDSGALSSLATASALTTVDTVVDAIKVSTDNLPSDPADQSLIIAATDALAAILGTPAGADLAADLAAIKSDSAAVLLDTGTDGVVISSATQDAIAAAILDLSDGVETGETIRQALRLMRSALVGKAAGLGTTTATFRDRADSKDRITATVDEDGNRTAISTDAT